VDRANQEGIVDQTDLGSETGALANRLMFFDPDDGWTKGQQR